MFTAQIPKIKILQSIVLQVVATICTHGFMFSSLIFKSSQCLSEKAKCFELRLVLLTLQFLFLHKQPLSDAKLMISSTTVLGARGRICVCVLMADNRMPDYVTLISK